MRNECISHFFLLPQTKPSEISRSMTGKSTVAFQDGGCCDAIVRRARTTAELLTVQPSASDASWCMRWRKRLVSVVSEWVRMMSGSLFGWGLRVAIQRVHNSLWRVIPERKQIVTCRTKKRAVSGGRRAALKGDGSENTSGVAESDGYSICDAYERNM